MGEGGFLFSMERHAVCMQLKGGKKYDTHDGVLVHKLQN